ncbi:MAG: amino acid adenylation domain-containing protein [Gammaproteobacteria bacterium]|nr:amino acid adenylation domain-containing protein [Gammaproteobacteria bacterium]
MAFLKHWMKAEPETPAYQITSLSPTERQQVLNDFNATARELPTDTLPALFEAQVRRTPDQPAVVFNKQQLSYAELNARANQLAHYLIDQGIGPDERVGLCLERSLELIVSLLAIVKAGAAYLPLDPDYPLARLAMMLDDSQVHWLVTQSSLRARLPETVAACAIIEWDASCLRGPTANPSCRTHAGNLAYVMYTSGSTGRPKGVALSQGALSNLVHWHTRQAELGTPARTLQFTSLNFDVSFQEIFSTWASGGCLVLINEQDRRDFQHLLAVIVQHRVQRLFMPFAVLDQLADSAQSEPVPSLEDVITAGEALVMTPALVRFLTRSGARLHNHYGPTESHVVTAYRLPENLPDAPERPPIGTPLANTRAYVLNAQLEPVPIGVPGELYLSGAGLARGYLNRPALTSERFVADPYAPTAGSRMYRTGDLVKWQADGALEFLGRVDQQVKVRGFRIEPGEIQAVLLAHEAVAQAAVIARDEPGGTQLVGYVVASGKAEADTAVLRRYLQTQLPAHLAPTHLIILESLPLTANGKLDRRALPAPTGLQAAYRAPRTPEETLLCELFAEVLGCVRVGLDDDFFALGGHSLLAIRLTSSIKRRLDKKLTLVQLFQTPTPGGLAVALSAATVDKPSSQLITMRAGNTPLPMILFHPFGNSLSCYTHLVTAIDSNYTVYGLQASEGSLTPLNYECFDDLADAYLAMIQQRLPQGPYRLLGWSAGGLIAFAVACRLVEQGHDVALLALLDTYCPALLPSFPKADYTLRLLSVFDDLTRRQLDVAPETLYSMEPDEQMVYLLDRAHQQGFIPKEFGLTHARQAWESKEKATALIDGYQPPNYHGQIELFRCREYPPLIEDPLLGWEKIAHKRVHVRWMPGAHHEIVDPYQATLLARQLNRCLSEPRDVIREGVSIPPPVIDFDTKK